LFSFFLILRLSHFPLFMATFYFVIFSFLL
jgi:hypothetical protein